MKLSDKTRMRAAGMTLVASVLALGLTAAGCGGSSKPSTSSTTAAGAQTQSAATAPASAPAETSPRPQTGGPPGPAPNASIEASIPGLVGSEHQIPKANTCDGANTSLPVRWGKMPPGTAEVAVFLLNLRPVNGKIFIGWAVTSLSPTSTGIPAGTVPAGAVVGHNDFGSVGYSICPPKGTREAYVVRVVALPRHLAAQSGFDAQRYYQEAEAIVKNVGITGGAYSRP
jgi:phosphatidylethanolamine-binding protein (PEBP) family uncharacterized protein